MAYEDKWSEAVRLGIAKQITSEADYGFAPVIQTQQESKKEPEQKKGNEVNIFTIVAIRLPSQLEQEKGVGAVIIAGPSVLTALDAQTACVQFGVNNAATSLKDAPAGLIQVTVKQGL